MPDRKNEIEAEKSHTRNTIDETMRLVELVDEFALHMKRRLIDKQKEGWQGWNNKDFMLSTLNIPMAIEECVERGDNIDAANWVMFLWHHTASVKNMVAYRRRKL